MRVLLFEVRKIFSPVCACIVLVLAVLFFHVNIYPCLRNMKASDGYVYAAAGDLIEMYGVSLEPEERAQLEDTLLKQYETQMKATIAGYPEFAAAGVGTLDDWDFLYDVKYYLSVTGSGMLDSYSDKEFFERFGVHKDADISMTPEETTLIETMQKDTEGAGRLFMLQLKLRHLRSETEELYDNLYDLYVRFDSEEFNSFEREIYADLFDSGAMYGIFPSYAQQSLGSCVPSACQLLLVVLCVLLAPVVTADNANGITTLQYTSKTGKRIMRKQFLAMLLASFLLTTVVVAVVFGWFLLNGGSVLLGCRMNSWLNLFGWYYFEGTFKYYLLLLILLFYMLALACTAFLYLFSRGSRGYIPLLLKTIPAGVAFLYISSLLLEQPFNFSNGGSGLYNMFRIPYIELIVPTLLLLVGIVTVFVALKRQKSKEV